MVKKRVRKRQKLNDNKNKNILRSEALIPKLNINNHHVSLDKGVDSHRLQQLLLWSLQIEIQPPLWFTFDWRSLINDVVWIIVDGLNYSNIERYQLNAFKTYKNDSLLMPLALETSKYNRKSALNDLISCNVAKLMGQKKKNKKYKKKERLANVKPKSYYLLTDQEMISHGYPSKTTQGFISTQMLNRDIVLFDKSLEEDKKQDEHKEDDDNDDNDNNNDDDNNNNDDDDDVMINLKAKDNKTNNMKLYAIDCEMCLTENGSELARITLIDDENNTLIDELVLPDAPIVNYCTEYSGITPQMMSNVTTTLKDIQEKFVKIVDIDDILVGHSLENDLKALKIYHPNVIDTALLYPHANGLPYKRKLKHLAYKYLKRKIQDNRNGHCSEEDAKAALDLAKLKFKFGTDFGTNCRNEQNIFQYIASKKKKCTLISSPERLINQPSSLSLISGKNDDDILKRTKSAICKEENEKYSLYCSMLSDLHNLQQSIHRDDKKPLKTLQDITTIVHTNKKFQDLMKQFDENICEIISSCKPNTMIIVSSGSPSTNLFMELQQERLKSFQNEAVETCNISEELLTELTRDLQKGFVFVHLKK